MLIAEESVKKLLNSPIYRFNYHHFNLDGVCEMFSQLHLINLTTRWRNFYIATLQIILQLSEKYSLSAEVEIKRLA